MQSSKNFRQPDCQMRYIILSEDVDGDMSPVEDLNSLDEIAITNHSMNELVNSGHINVFHKYNSEFESKKEQITPKENSHLKMQETNAQRKENEENFTDNLLNPEIKTPQNVSTESRELRFLNIQINNRNHDVIFNSCLQFTESIPSEFIIKIDKENISISTCNKLIVDSSIENIISNNIYQYHVSDCLQKRSLSCAQKPDYHGQIAACDYVPEYKDYEICDKSGKNKLFSCAQGYDCSGEVKFKFDGLDEPAYCVKVNTLEERDGTAHFIRSLSQTDFYQNIKETGDGEFKFNITRVDQNNTHKIYGLFELEDGAQYKIDQNDFKIIPHFLLCESGYSIPFVNNAQILSNTKTSKVEISSANYESGA